MAGRGYAFDIECLTSEKIHSAKNDQRDAAALALNETLKLVHFDQLLTASRPRNDECGRWVKPACTHMRANGIHVRWETRLFNENLESVLRWLVEGGQHQVKIDRQAVHHHNFARNASYEPRPAFAKDLVVGIPGRAAGEMSIDRQPGPVIQLLLHRLARRSRLQTQRVACKIGGRFSIRARRNEEFVA